MSTSPGVKPGACFRSDHFEYDRQILGTQILVPIPNGLSVPCKYTLISKSGNTISPAFNVPLVPPSVDRAPSQPVLNKMEEATIGIRGNRKADPNCWQLLFNANHLTAVATVKGSTEGQVGGGRHESDASV